MKGKPDSPLQKSHIPRLANALPFVMTVLSVGGWSAGFYAWQETGPGTVGEGLRCLAFFGGLAAAVLLGEAGGAFLRRLAWRRLVRQGIDRDEEMQK